MGRWAPRLLVAATAAAGLSAVAVGVSDEQSTEGLPAARAGATLEPVPLGQIPVFAETESPAVERIRDPFTRPPRAGVLVDLSTGRVMWSSDAGRVLPVASLTKMMNALVAVDLRGPSTPVTVTRSASSVGGSTVGSLPAGRAMRLEDLLAGMLVVSGNDAALAIADELGPGRARFVKSMNARARRMGLTCTSFRTPTGLSSSDRSCARDLAKIAAAVLASPRLARIVARPWDTIPLPGSTRKARLRNRNPLLQARYPGTTGVKTGHTEAAGWCLAASAARGNGRALLGVLLHSPNTGIQMRQLFDKGFEALGRHAGFHSGRS